MDLFYSSFMFQEFVLFAFYVPGIQELLRNGDITPDAIIIYAWADLIQGMGLVNVRSCYIVMPSLIGWAHTQSDSWWVMWYIIPDGLESCLCKLGCVLISLCFRWWGKSDRYTYSLHGWHGCHYGDLYAAWKIMHRFVQYKENYEMCKHLVLSISVYYEFKL